MDGVVVSIAFSRLESEKLRVMMAESGDKYLSEFLRKKLGFTMHRQASSFIYTDELEEMQSVHAIAKAVISLSRRLLYEREHNIYEHQRTRRLVYKHNRLLRKILEQAGIEDDDAPVVGGNIVAMPTE